MKSIFPLLLLVSSAFAGRTSEQVVPRTSKDGFAACLLVMDDNHKLTEWIAFHYFALNLRHLVITVDPHSKTSPKSVLDKWRHLITIEEWTDKRFMGERLMRNPNHSPEDAHNQHRLRQRTFYNKCLTHMKRKRRTWTMFVDSDEYVTLNSKIVKDSSSLTSRPGHVSDYFLKLTREARADANHHLRHHFGGKCVLVPRTLYGAQVSTHDDVSQAVPEVLKGLPLDTLKWRHRSVKSDELMLTKGIVDVSRLTRKELGSRSTAHKPSELGCKGQQHWQKYNLPIGIHHYLGDWDSYSYRDDIRGGKGGKRNYESWKAKGLKSFSVDDEIRPWIQGFVSTMGEETAKILLADVGVIKY